MRCIVHIWTQEERGQRQFCVHILPLNSPQNFQAKEAFLSEMDLSQRLAEIGLSVCHRERTRRNLEEGLSAMWANIEVAEAQLQHHPVAA